MTLHTLGFEYNSDHQPKPSVDDAIWGPLYRVPFVALSELGDWMWRNTGWMLLGSAGVLAAVVVSLAVAWRMA